MADANRMVLTPSSSVDSEMRAPTASAGVISWSPASAISANVVSLRSVTSTASGIQIVGDLAQNRGDLAAVGLVGVATATKPGADAVEQLHQVLDDDRHVVGRATGQLAEA